MALEVWKLTTMNESYFINSTSSSLMSESCCPLVPFFVTLFASCSINCCLFTLSCAGGGAVPVPVVGVGVVKLAVILGSIGGTDVNTGSWVVCVACSWPAGTVGMVGFTAPHWLAFGIVNRTGLPETGTTVCAPATPRAISCNACACNAFTHVSFSHFHFLEHLKTHLVMPCHTSVNYWFTNKLKTNKKLSCRRQSMPCSAVLNVAQLH